ncbi:MAG TPA: ACT domain-containing protein [Spirochaetia bacterium]|nr:ACT domain-containing protein [Spirochaetia bacterium]
MATGFVVLTAVGPDRVGIVDDISGFVAETGCNIEESKMAVLGGEFALMMLVSGPQESVEALAKAVPAFGEKLGLRIGCHSTREPQPERGGRPYLLKAVSLDTPGIVHAVTAVIRRHSINIEDLETETVPAPWTGAPMFQLSARLVIGPSVAVAGFKEDLQRLQREQDLDIVLRPVFAPGAEAVEG